MRISLQQISTTEWKASRGDLDFHIRLENKEFSIDVFLSGVEDVTAAYLTSFCFDSWDTVEALLRDLNPQTKAPEQGYGDRHKNEIVKDKKP